jgi:excisionase family DNA binding protein
MTKAKQIPSDAAPLETSRATPLPTLLSVSAVAIELSVCTKTVRRLIARGALPSCRVGRLVRIRATDLAEFVASGTGS